MLSYRKLAMRVLGRPLHTGGSDSPRPASQRAAAFALTAAMLITLAAPAFAGTWHIENGDITISAGESGNDVTQNNVTTKNDTNTIITNENKDIASSHTVTIDAGNDKVEVTLEDVNIKADSGSALISKGDVTLTLKGDNHLTGGNGGSSSYGGDGITSSGSLTISGGTVTATGGDSTGSVGSGGSGIYSSVIDLSGSLELTAKAGSPNGKALSRVGSELDLNTIKDKLDPGAKVTATDADGKVIQQVSIPRPVEPEEPSSSSDSGSATPSAPASFLPGLTVTDKDGQRISYTSIRGNNVLSLSVGRFTASLHASLSTLRQLRAEGIETITFQTILCSTTLSVDELLAMGGVVPVGEGTAPHILAVSLVGYPSANIVTDLGAQGICISAGSACHQGKASHVVSALGLDKKTAAGVIRISFSPDNTREDVDVLCQALLAHRDSRFPML